MYHLKVVKKGRATLYPATQIETNTILPDSFAVKEGMKEPGVEIEAVYEADGQREVRRVQLPRDGESAYIMGTVRNPDGTISHGATIDSHHWPPRQRELGATSGGAR